MKKTLSLLLLLIVILAACGNDDAKAEDTDTSDKTEEKADDSDKEEEKEENKEETSTSGVTIEGELEGESNDLIIANTDGNSVISAQEDEILADGFNDLGIAITYAGTDDNGDAKLAKDEAFKMTITMTNNSDTDYQMQNPKVYVKNGATDSVEITKVESENLITADFEITTGTFISEIDRTPVEFPAGDTLTFEYNAIIGNAYKDVTPADFTVILTDEDDLSYSIASSYVVAADSEYAE